MGNPTEGDREDARYESAAGQLNQAVAAAISTAQDQYHASVKASARTSDEALRGQARLIAAMMGDPAQDEAVYRAITTTDTDISDGSLAQAARDALMPFACGACGTEVAVPGQEPDHFGWCPLAPGPDEGEQARTRLERTIELLCAYGSARFGDDWWPGNARNWIGKDGRELEYLLDPGSAELADRADPDTGGNPA